MLDLSWVVTFLVALVTWFITRQWFKVKSLPPGPYPLPILGNLLRFRKVTLVDAYNELRREYGGVFTVWFGSIPFVVVAEYRFIKEALIDRKTDFAGRPQFPIISTVLGKNMGISSSDYSRPWENLRKMGHSAIRKYATSTRLPPAIDELAEECVQKMVNQKDGFNPETYIHHLVFNIIASTVIGQRYKEDDPVFIQFQDALEAFQKYTRKGLLAYLMPILKPFFRKSTAEMVKNLQGMREFMNDNLKKHIATYQSNDIRDMMDSLINAREELLAELGQQNAPHLNDSNLFQVIMDIFGAAIDTTTSTIRWLLLYSTMYPEIQDKIIQEIRDNIGDRMPTQDDRTRCHYTVAVILEITRIQAVAPFGLPHQTITDTKLGGHSIPKGTAVMFHFGAVHYDPKYWEEPDEFMPRRFLELDGTLSDTRSSQYLPFGLGRRSCIGEKLAMEDMFMVVVGIFRRCRLTMKDPPVDLKSEASIFQIPKKHTLVATLHK